MATADIPKPHPPEPARQARNLIGADETTPAAVQAVAPHDAPPYPDRETRPADLTPIAAPTEEMDAWPTQSLSGEEMDPPDEKTRIGVPAYEVSARLATEESAQSSEPALRPSQAVRVVVWRALDGVHVAPHGTRVSAISVDAVLVALDPSADLASWLSGK
ncbi:MAG TPA: hypothetical protein VIY73_05425 [Polyangiaceae bacterium]